MIARFFVGDKELEYEFDETLEMHNAVDYLSMRYYEELGVLPIAIFVSPDLYSYLLKNIRYTTQLGLPYGHHAMNFITSLGTVMVKQVNEPSERFIYAGNLEGYNNALVSKRFEEIVLEIDDET